MASSPASAHQHRDGVQGQTGQAADDGAVDPDELQVRPEQQLQAPGGLDRVPPPDGAADQRRPAPGRSGSGPCGPRRRGCARAEAARAGSSRSRAPVCMIRLASQVRSSEPGCSAWVRSSSLTSRHTAAAKTRICGWPSSSALISSPRRRSSSEVCRSTASFSRPAVELLAQRVVGVGGHVVEHLPAALQGGWPPGDPRAGRAATTVSRRRGGDAARSRARPGSG